MILGVENYPTSRLYGIKVTGMKIKSGSSNEVFWDKNVCKKNIQTLQDVCKVFCFLLNESLDGYLEDNDGKIALISLLDELISDIKKVGIRLYSSSLLIAFSGGQSSKIRCCLTDFAHSAVHSCNSLDENHFFHLDICESLENIRDCVRN